MDSDRHARRCLRLIFWGLLLTFLHFRVNDFDLLPDWLGFILVLLGARGLVGVSHRFNLAAVLSVAALVLYGLSWVRELVGHPAFGWVVMFCRVALLWHVAGGVADLCASRGNVVLQSAAIKWRTVYCVSVFLVALIAELGPPAEFLFAVGIAVLVCGLVVLHVIWRAGSDAGRPTFAAVSGVDEF